MARPRENEIERFFKYVEKTKKCWFWKGSNVRGYGQFMVDRKNLKAHRFSYEYHVGKIPSGMLVCHTCDNPSCVNPKHLFIGTWKDNVQDMIKKGRRYDTAGENNGQSKITMKIALEIREKYSLNKSFGHERKKYSTAKLGEMYGISQSVVYDIVKGNYWK